MTSCVGEWLFLGVDLAWSTAAHPRETGVVALASSGAILNADWTRGVDETARWISRVSEGRPNVLAFVDAPLVVANATGQRLCERQTGQRYGRWKVSANSTNLGTGHLAGVSLLARLESAGWAYHDGLDGPPARGRHVSECYPYTTLVGASELGYEVERPRYKRKPRSMRAAEWRPQRTRTCDELISRLVGLAQCVPRLDLTSHATTDGLGALESPLADLEYKHREDLIDAVLCAWTAALWVTHGCDRCQVLGDSDGDGGRRATIIAPARPEQRRPVTS